MDKFLGFLTNPGVNALLCSLGAGAGASSLGINVARKYFCEVDYLNMLSYQDQNIIRMVLNNPKEIIIIDNSFSLTYNEVPLLAQSNKSIWFLVRLIRCLEGKPSSEERFYKEVAPKNLQNVSNKFVIVKESKPLLVESLDSQELLFSFSIGQLVRESYLQLLSEDF
jgi:hypothetical protein